MSRTSVKWVRELDIPSQGIVSVRWAINNANSGALPVLSMPRTGPNLATVHQGATPSAHDAPGSHASEVRYGVNENVTSGIIGNST